jgi:hypothetical protein
MMNCALNHVRTPSLGHSSRGKGSAVTIVKVLKHVLKPRRAGFSCRAVDGGECEALGEVEGALVDVHMDAHRVPFNK